MYFNLFQASNLKQRVLYVYDPMGKETRYHRKLLKNWKGFWRHHSPSSSQKWKVVSSPHENQEDGNNCGILVLKFAEFYLKQIESFCNGNTMSFSHTTKACMLYRAEFGNLLLQITDKNSLSVYVSVV
ncbi:uncharacterized protein LOC108950842 [Ciona intestinalis]